MIVREHANAARSKLENFAPKISLCAELVVLSVRNANIVFGGTAEELGILSFELFSASPTILNYTILNWLNTSYQFKTEQFTMRHGAQFVIQNSKFLIRPRFSSERGGWQVVGVYEICPCEGLPGIADVAGML